ncbi:MAG: hypothetical protein ACKOZW_02970 [Cyanobium sp.]
MRPTWEGLLFRTFRLLIITTVIAGAFSGCLSALEGLQGPAPSAPSAPTAPSAPGPGAPAAGPPAVR